MSAGEVTSKRPLPLRALVHALCIAIIVHRVSQLFDVSAGVVTWATASWVVALALWALEKRDEESLSTRILGWLALDYSGSNSRRRVTAALLGAALYAVFLPSVAITCRQDGQLRIHVNGVLERAPHCIEGQHFVIFPSQLGLRWRPMLVMEDERHRFVRAELAPMDANPFEYGKDFSNPTAVLFFLPASRVRELPVTAPTTVTPACPSEARFCVWFEDLWAPFEVPKAGLFMGRDRVSSDAIKLRNERVLAGDPNGLPLGLPSTYLAHRFHEGWLDVTLMTKDEGRPSCEYLRCYVASLEENLCELKGTPGPCP